MRGWQVRDAQSPTPHFNAEICCPENASTFGRIADNTSAAADNILMTESSAPQRHGGNDG